jgi:uncharacterized protein YjiS (DUF1127 family)
MSFLNLFISAGKAFSAWRRREQAYAELMALDERSLADIGIHRLQICALAESARKRTEFPMNNFTPNHETVLATRQHTNAGSVVKNADAALATIRRPASLRSRAKRFYMGYTASDWPRRHSSHAGAMWRRGRGRGRR